MPDISGFTDFVNTTEIEHSRHIISELLESLIDANTMGLQLAEIEGDALFMYTLDTTSFETVVKQSQKMLEEFTNHVEKYETQRICQCGACMNASNLKVKFIVHYGEIAFMRVKHIVKPYGADVIKTHRLLKNSIPANQYLLISSETADYYEMDLNQDSSFQTMQDEYDFGKVKYFYKNYTQFKVNKNNSDSELAKKPTILPKLKYKTVLDTEILDAYNVITDFSIRTVWYKLVDKLLFDELRINRMGTRHNCISGSNVYKVDTLGTKGSNGQLIYGEKTEDIEHLKSFLYYMTLTKGSKGTFLTTEVYFDYSNDDVEIQRQIKETMDKVWKDSICRLSRLLTKAKVNIS